MCGDAKDFFVDKNYDVCCGYCGFKVAEIKEQFLISKNQAERIKKNKFSRLANKQ